MPRHTDFDLLERDFGIILPEAQDFMTRPQKQNYALAMDAQPSMITVGNAGIPAMFTTLVDPDVIKVILAPLEGAEIIGEQKRGTWIDDTMVFSMVEMTGEVSSYGDYNNNGRAGLNSTWPQRQSYHFQVIVEYGEREAERAGAQKLNWVSELNTSAASTLNRYSDLTYHFGVAGLQNYGLLNDPRLTPALTPAVKAAGGTKWLKDGVIVASANEVYTDVQTLFVRLVAQSNGAIGMNTPLTIVTDPATSVAMTATNNFNVSVRDLLAKNFPNLKFKTSIRYATTAGNMIQLIADTITGGGDVGYCAFTEKLRAHPIIKDLSSFKQKQSQGTWGAIIRYPVSIAQMLGV